MDATTNPDAAEQNNSTFLQHLKLLLVCLLKMSENE